MHLASGLQARAPARIGRESLHAPPRGTRPFPFVYCVPTREGDFPAAIPR